MTGVDLSNYQAGLELQSLKADGKEFAILKATEGITIQDRSFKTFAKAANGLDFPIGAYCYGHATDVERARSEAAFILHVVKGFKLPLGIYYDVEAAEQLALSGKQLQEICEAFCQVIRAAGYSVGLYGSEYNLWYKIDHTKLPSDVIKWVAHYGKAPAFDCDLWQRTDQGRVLGYHGNVDIDEVFSERFYSMVNKSNDKAEPAVKPGMLFPPNPTVLAFQLWLNYNGYVCATDGQKTKEFFKILREFVDDMENC